MLKQKYSPKHQVKSTRLIGLAETQSKSKHPLLVHRLLWLVYAIVLFIVFISFGGRRIVNEIIGLRNLQEGNTSNTSNMYQEVVTPNILSTPVNLNLSSDFKSFAKSFNRTISGFGSSSTIKNPQKRPYTSVNTGYDHGSIMLRNEMEGYVELTLWYLIGSETLLRAEIVSTGDNTDGLNSAMALLVASGLASDTTKAYNILVDIGMTDPSNVENNGRSEKQVDNFIIGYESRFAKDWFTLWIESPSFVRGPNHYWH